MPVSLYSESIATCKTVTVIVNLLMDVVRIYNVEQSNTLVWV